MDSGLKENFPDRVSPIKAHVDGLRGLGAETGPLNPHVNAVTSDVVRVSPEVYGSSSVISTYKYKYMYTRRQVTYKKASNCIQDFLAKVCDSDIYKQL